MVSKVWDWNSPSVKPSCETNFFFFFFLFSVENLKLRKMDRLTNTQRIKIIKTCKNSDGRWMAIFQTKFSSVMMHISHWVGMLINKIVVFIRRALVSSV